MACLIPLELSFYASAAGIWYDPRFKVHLWQFLGVSSGLQWDAEMGFFLFGAAVCLLVLFRPWGWWKSAFCTLSALSVALLPLPIMVYFIDFREWQLHILWSLMGTPLQWFTNADLLACLLTVFLLAIGALKVRANRASYLFVASALLSVVLIVLYALSLQYAPPCHLRYGVCYY